MSKIDVFHRYGEPTHYCALVHHDVEFHQCDPVHASMQLVRRRRSVKEYFAFLYSCLRSYLKTVFIYKPIRIYSFAPDSMYLIPWLLLWWRPGRRYFHTSFADGWAKMSPPKRWLMQANMFVLKRYVKGVACVNLAAKSTFKDCAPTYLVEHSLDMAAISQVKTRARRSVYLGRMVAYKNISEIARACSEEQFEVDFIGERTALSDEVSVMFDGRYVNFLGRRSREWIFENLATYEALFLLSEEREPFGIAILEAMAAGCIPIVTKTAGTQTIFRTWRDYPFYVDPATPGSVNEAIRRLQDNEIVETTRLRLAEYSAHYHSDSMGKKWDRLFEETQ